MKIATIRSSWMPGYGYRLDCQPYLGGALETKVLLEALPMRKEPLSSLTAGFDGGIYNGPKFSRTYVETPEFGVPFVGSSSMLYADLSDLPLLSKKQAYGRQLRHLELQPGMSLISCSGTIGKMVYARRDMTGIWSSQHILKVVADPAKIRSGYLYAYLSSKFGVPLVVSGTYGSIIQSLGPNNISDLPVPRLGDAEEEGIHDLVEQAAELRARATNLKIEAVAELEDAAALPPFRIGSNPVPFGYGFVRSGDLESRLDTHFFSPVHVQARHALETCRTGAIPVAAIAGKIVEPLRFKRIEIAESGLSVGLYGTSAILQLDPQASYPVPRLPSLSQYLVDRNTILIPRSGSLNGIIGTATLPIGDVVGGLVSEDAIRIFNDRPEMAGFLYVALSSAYGMRQLKCRAYGSAIPHLDVAQIGRVLVPKLPRLVHEQLGAKGFQVGELCSEAIVLERKAVKLLEEAIETHA